MKVKDLILRLNECDPNAMVVVDGYEGGVTELRNITDSVDIALDINTENYYGEHELTPGNNYPDATHASAVYLPR